MKTSDIRMGDPFVLPVAEEGAYYLFGTTDANAWDDPADPAGPDVGFDCYRSRNLTEWEGPIPAFRPAKGFWANRQFWAAEAHRYRGAYYLFGSFKAEGACRGTQILRADAPAGPYAPISDRPVTPRGWECLDGTLYVDEDDAPWMVFCHEWLQIQDGSICAMRLADDLRTAAGPPELLFHASAAPWAVAFCAEGRTEPAYITDGPFLHRAANGGLLMLWSSGGAGGYTMGVARSENGRILGPWTQAPQPLWTNDGGHGMIFRTFEGQLTLAFHQPNDSTRRPVFVRAEERNGQLILAEKP
jgi:beta-xylosidase